MGNILKMYTIYDRVAEMHGDIFLAVNHSVAIRNFHSVLSKANIDTVGDYFLHYLGDFTQNTAHIELNKEADRVIASGSEYMDKNKV